MHRALHPRRQQIRRAEDGSPAQRRSVDSDDITLLAAIALAEAAGPALGVVIVSEDRDEGAADVGGPVEVGGGEEVQLWRCGDDSARVAGAEALGG